MIDCQHIHNEGNCSMQRRIITRIAVMAGTLVAAVGMTGLTAAHAADPTEPEPALTGVYPVSGSTFISKSKITVPLGPTKLTADIFTDPSNPDNLAFNATLPLPPKTVKFKAFGYLPVQAKVYFTEVGPVTGAAVFDNETTSFSINSSATYVVTLRDVYVGGAAAKVGDNCQTRYPIYVSANSSGPFDLFGGGDLSATYDLGRFNNCSTSTDLINLIVPSNNNTLRLKLGALTIADDTATAKKLQKRFAAKK